MTYTYQPECDTCDWIGQMFTEYMLAHSSAVHHSVIFRNHSVGVVTTATEGPEDD